MGEADGSPLSSGGDAGDTPSGVEALDSTSGDGDGPRNLQKVGDGDVDAGGNSGVFSRVGSFVGRVFGR